jgi:hypothetical protein
VVYERPSSTERCCLGKGFLQSSSVLLIVAPDAAGMRPMLRLEQQSSTDSMRRHDAEHGMLCLSNNSLLHVHSTVLTRQRCWALQQLSEPTRRAERAERTGDTTLPDVLRVLGADAFEAGRLAAPLLGAGGGALPGELRRHLATLEQRVMEVRFRGKPAAGPGLLCRAQRRSCPLRLQVHRGLLMGVCRICS